MLGNKRRDTKPELAVRRLLHAQGLRYRVDFRPTATVRSRADIVFTKQKVAVFIDGCFWHSCPVHATQPKANADYWLPKLARNAARDAEVTELLTDVGWTVLRFWEHEKPETAVAVIVTQVRRVSMRRNDFEF
jgi:DNA mismatch endonuclease (patch repair protein)